MDKHAEIALLLDIYGELLTDKQRDIMDQYYDYDLSLQEIAENEGISKQGVHDLIKRAEHTLYKTEERLRLMKRLTDLQSELDRIYHEMEDAGQGQSASDGPAAQRLHRWKEEIGRLISSCMGG